MCSRSSGVSLIERMVNIDDLLGPRKAGHDE
jgi:hypothetical protein